MSPLETFLKKNPAAAADVKRLHTLVLKAAPKLTPVLQGTMLAYGPFRYRYESGREGDSARLSLACRKSGLALYVNCVDDLGYLAEHHAAAFPKAKVGKSCINFKTLADLDEAALLKLFKLAAKTKGAGEL